MCGIFGVTMTTRSAMGQRAIEDSVRALFRLSESRGKEAAGLAVLTDKHIRVYKAAIPASDLIRTRSYRKVISDSFADRNGGSAPLTIIGHSRLVTSGIQTLNENNQPVIAANSVAIHNGIIVNVDDLWRRFSELPRTGDVDTEVLLRLLEEHYRQTGSLVAATQATFALIEGTASVAVLFRDQNAVLLASNNGSLYSCRSEDGQLMFFASERYILTQLARRSDLRGRIDAANILQCLPGTGMLIDTDDLNVNSFSLSGDNGTAAAMVHNGERKIINILPSDSQRKSNGFHDGPPAAPTIVLGNQKRLRALLQEGMNRVPEMRRCTRCVLPESMPFIDFDADGVCNYCRNYRKGQPKGADELMSYVEQFRRPGNGPECVLALSGGRDSTYSLHYVRTVLGLRPVTYTYDWGMVTDLARRNQARICGKLGVEHIVISADITRKRENIRKNVSAWLRKPDLGTVPLFMAGDKQFFYHANRLREQIGVDLVVFSMNPLERTDFKTGFCGVSRTGTKDCYYGLPRWSRVRLASYYAKQFLTNPAYINTSLLDTLGAYWSYYFIPHDYLQFFHYIPWDEQHIDQTLHDEYDWELASDTKSTWRIGDGTAPFYNYIYYIGAGFTENDTFRSNQIREGVINRETALKSVQTENQPRIESMQWYCDTIGIDCEQAIKIINAMPKRYTPNDS